MSRTPKAALAACVLLLALLVAVIPASAQTTVTIVGENFISDTFCGVPAYYDEGAGTNGKWQCNEYINRFYAEAYGLSILAYSNTGLVMQSDGYAFVKTTSPKPGDILYATAEQRGRSSDHWAIVKSFSNGKATLIEQNWTWDGVTTVNRTVDVPNDGFDIWTPVGVGRADPQLKNLPAEPTTARTTTTTTTMRSTATTRTTTTTSTTTTTASSHTITETTTTTSTATSSETTTEASPTAAPTQTAGLSAEETLAQASQGEENDEELRSGTQLAPMVWVVIAAIVLVLAAVIVLAVLLLKKRKV